MLKGDQLLAKEAERLAALSDEELERDWLIYLGKQYQKLLETMHEQIFRITETTAFKEAMAEENKRRRILMEQQEPFLRQMEERLQAQMLDMIEQQKQREAEESEQPETSEG